MKAVGRLLSALLEVNPMTTFVSFNRRYKRDGSVDSICVHCQQTIATARSLIDLVPSEIAHTCESTQILDRESQEMRRA